MFHKKEEAERILEMMSRNGLSGEQKKLLTEYFDVCLGGDNAAIGLMRQRENFKNYYAASRSIYLHKDDDRSLLSYGVSIFSMALAMISLSFSMSNTGANSIDAIVFAVIGIAMGLLAISIVVYGLCIKLRKRTKNMEELYLYINRV